VLEAIGHPVDDLFAHARDGQEQKQAARKENDGQRRLPRDVHVETDCVGKISVERHAGCKRDGIVGVDAHHQGGRGSRYARGKDDTLGRHSGLREDLRIHDDDVGHRHEGGEATEHFLFDGGVIFGEFEVTLDQIVCLDSFQFLF
jgi:hypothetical protein